MSNGIILYDGPSALDGSPIIAVATGILRKSRNAKTGPMVQVWIMHRDVAPTKASALGLDAAVCGDCKHRRSLGGACYVTLHQAPLSVWRAYHRGSYPAVSPKRAARVLLGEKVRFGAYGDPAAVPGDVWAPLRKVASGYTGYTHQWRTLDASEWGWLMASTDTAAEYSDATAAGWRTFHVVANRAHAPDASRQCPSDAVGLSCDRCRLCDGTTRGARRPNVWIEVHGAMTARFGGEA